MKRTSVFVAGIACAALLVAAVVHAQEFTQPIPIGGDDPGLAGNAVKGTGTQIKFFRHPVTPGQVNFTDPMRTIKPVDSPAVFADDVVQVPGFGDQAHGVDVDDIAAQPMLDDSNPRAGGGNVDPVGPSDFVYSLHSSGLTLSATLGLDYDMARGDRFIRRLPMGDLRNLNTPLGETINALFGMDALEEGLVGNAEQKTPYTEKTYPAFPVAMDQSQQLAFGYCKFQRPMLPYKGAFVANDAANCKALGGLKYKDQYFYDIADLGNGLATASYDPFLLSVEKPEVYLKLYAKHGSMTINFETANTPSGAQPINVAYFSPTAFFRRIDTGAGAGHYRFSGYTSFEMPEIKIDTTTSPDEFDLDIMPFLLTNWMVPVLTNPIAIEAVDGGGKSSWQNCGMPTCNPQVPHPDTDLVIAYQSTLVSPDQLIFDLLGRPAAFADGHVIVRDRLKICADNDCTAPAADPDLTVAKFPEDAFSLAIRWNQERKWEVGDTLGDYVALNPSHVWDPSAAWIVGPGVYDTALVTDFAADAVNRREHLLVPSVCADTVRCGDNAIIYVLDTMNPKNDPMIGFVADNATFGGFEPGPGALPGCGNGVKDAGETCDPTAPYPDNKCIGGTAPPGGSMCNDKCTGCVDPYLFSCTQEAQNLQKTGLRLPQQLLLTRPGDGLAPFKIKTANVDGDNCMDLAVNWRGNKVRGEKPDFRFDAGDALHTELGKVVTLVLRREDSGGCVVQPQVDLPLPVVSADLPAGKTAGVSDLAFGDFNGDGKVDIALGDMTPEKISEGTDAGKFAAFGYVFWGDGTGFFNTVDPAGVKRVRLGFKSDSAGTDIANIAGVAAMNADKLAPDNSEALAQINGRYLALPDIGCSNYETGGEDDPTVQAPFETYVSLYENMISAWAVTNMPNAFEVAHPFVGAAEQPIPQRCVAPEIERCIVKVDGADVALPLYKADECCHDPCKAVDNSTAWNKSEWLTSQPACQKYLYVYAVLGQNCPLHDYVKAWDHCGLHYIKPGFINQWEGGGASLEPMPAYRPDEVVGQDGHAIAVSADLVPAATMATKATDLGVRQLNVQEFSFGQGMELLETLNTFPFAEMLSQGMLNIAPGNEEVARAAEALQSDPEINKAFARQMAAKVNLIGAPRSFEAMLMQPVAAGFVVASKADGRSAFAATRGDRAGGMAGCSLIPEAGSTSEGAAAFWSRALERFVGLFVRDAGAEPHSYGTCDVAFACTNKKNATENCLTGYMCRWDVDTPGDPQTYCLRGERCGDGCFAGFSSTSIDTQVCDINATAHTPGVSNNGCPAGQVCSLIDPPPPYDTCECKASTGGGTPTTPDIPPLTYRVKLPMGQIPPGYRESTAIVRKVPTVNCDGDKIKEPLQGEECDIGTPGDPVPPALLPGVLQDQCGDAETVAGTKVIVGCGMAYCNCLYSYPQCQSLPGSECTDTATCELLGPGAICGIDCKCHLGTTPGDTPGDTPGGDTPGGTPTITPSEIPVNCSAKCITFPDESIKPDYDKLNAAGRETTGLQGDDFACPPEGKMQFICTKVSTDTKAQLSASLAGPPYMLIQQGGSKFLDSSLLQWMYNEKLDAPVRIAPLEALEAGSAQSMKALVLPDLSASAEGGAMLAVEPMATTSATISSSGTQLINNMIELKIFPLTGEAAQKVMQAGGQTAGQALVFEWITTLPPLCGPYTAVPGVENVESCQIPIQEKLYDTAQYLAVVRESLSATPNLADYTDYKANSLEKSKDLPWQADQKFAFSLAFDDDVRNVGVISGPPTMFGMGSGSCKCNMGGAAPAASELILMLVSVLLPAGGFAAWRVRRRGRR